MAVKVRQKNGKWWVFIDHHGKRKAKCVGDKRAAQQVAEKIQAKLVLGQFEITDEKEQLPPLTDYAERWLETYAAVHCKPATHHRYTRDYRLHISPTLGHKRLTEVSRQDIKQLIAEKRNSGLSWESVRNILAPLREMLNHAVEDELLTTNPATRVGRFNKRPAERRQNIDPLTREELRLFLDTARQFPRHYPFFLLLSRTGLRLGEALALQWGDIDWHGEFLEVRRTFCRVSKKLLTPKSGKIRRVDMSRQLSETLKVLLTERKKETLQKGWAEVPLWVNISTTGTMLDGDHVRKRAFYPILKQAELRHVRLHDLRHTFASLLIQNGESLAYVRDQMGHHSIQVTVDTYGHLVPGGNRQAVDRLDDPEEYEPEATSRNLSATDHKNTVSRKKRSA
jgi:integrase